MGTICVVTGYTPSMREYATFAERTMRYYAQKHRFCFEFCDEMPLSRPAYWLKIWVLQKLIQKYEYVFWVDADAVFVNFDINILDDIDDTKDLHVHNHKFESFNYQIPNSGVMLVKRSEWTKNFLIDIWNTPIPAYSQWQDNAALIIQMGYHSLLDPTGNTVDTPNNNILEHIGSLSERWNCVPWDCSETKPMIIHFPGSGHETRKKMIPCHAAEAFYNELMGKSASANS